MPFCPECRSLVYPDKKTGKLACRKCEIEVTPKGPHIVSSKATEKEVIVIDENTRQIETRGTTEVECPKCGHGKAYAEFRQTRKSDEPQTMFCECMECAHRWRVY
jgi:transcription factor S